MPLRVHFDETGDTGLKNIDPQFPVFLIMMVICEVEEYVRSIVPQIFDIKFKYFGVDSRHLMRCSATSALMEPFSIQSGYTRRRIANSRLSSLISSGSVMAYACFAAHFISVPTSADVCVTSVSFGFLS